MCVFFVVLHNVAVDAEQFNIFKSYGNAKVRPVQYAAQRRAHATSEYLDPIQMKMMQYRKGPDVPQVMFTDKGWSGFNQKANQNQGEIVPVSTTATNKAGAVRTKDFSSTVRRRLEQTAVNGAKRTQQSIRRIGVPRDTSEDAISSEQQRNSIEQTSVFLVFSALLMAIFGIILFVGYGRRRADCTKRVGQVSLDAESGSQDSQVRVASRAGIPRHVVPVLTSLRPLPLFAARTRKIPTRNWSQALPRPRRPRRRGPTTWQCRCRCRCPRSP